MTGRPAIDIDLLLAAGAFTTAALITLWLTRDRSVGGSVAQPEAIMPVPGGTWPRPGRVVAFGYQRSPTHTHQGVDFGAPTGTPVLAARSGVVTHALTQTRPGFSGYGRCVVVETGATSATPPLWYMYAHLDEVRVTPGQVVRAGDQIGTVGRTCFTIEEPGRLCGGAHLHFEISPRPYPQHSEAWRYDPEQVLVAIDTGLAPTAWRTT